MVAGPALSGRLPPSLRIGVVIVAGAPLFGLLRFAPDLTVAAGADDDHLARIPAG